MISLIPITSGRALDPTAGQKAASIAWLKRQQVPTPTSWVLPWTAHEAWRQSGRGDPAWLSGLDLGRKYAVRSSANVEDNPTQTFAGQFESVLNVSGAGALLEAIETVYRSANSELLTTYLSQNGLNPSDVKMAVLIQEMVEPRLSGVAFSKHPVTGLDEIVVEAVEGSGEKLVQGGVTPWRWVRKWGKLIQAPADAPVDPALITTVIDQTTVLAEKYGAPIDLEWVFDGRQVVWVQSRPITTLKKLNFYSNRISKEVLPGIIKPLIWSTNIPLVNSAWIDLFTELIGRNDLQPEALTKAIHYRAYFNMGAIGKIFTSLGMAEETLEVMMGLEGGDQKPAFRPSLKIVRHLPRMIFFALHKMRFAAVIERELPPLIAYYKNKHAEPLPDSEALLLEDIDELVDNTVDMAYLNIVSPILAQLTGGLLNRRLKKSGIDPTAIDLKAGEPAFDAYDPNIFLETLHKAYQELDEPTRSAVARGDEVTVRRHAPAGFMANLDAFLDRFGHFSDSGNDFSYPPWRETPSLVLKMIANFAPGSKAAAGDRKLPPLTGRTRRLAQRARRFQLYREQISATYIFGYGLLRDRFLALGRSLAGRGVLAAADDIFYLTVDEVRQRVAGPDEPAAATLVQQRREEIAAVEDAILPELVYGEAIPPLITSAAAAANTLRGIPTAPGYYRGPVRIITQLSDFANMIPGAVLVIPFSDVSWTPLFAQAGAVVAESGGMLSHSAIVAREYGLPAVLSIDGVTRLLQNDEIVTVNGFDGSIILHRDSKF